MLPKRTAKAIGKLALSIYEFEKTGDELPMHTHEPGTAHLTMVNKGSIRAYGYTWERVLVAGNLVIFAPNDPHAFEALEDNTRITNLVY